MSDAAKIDVSATLTTPEPIVYSLTTPTPLASALGSDPLAGMAGRITAARFHPLETELAGLLHACGVFDLGWRACIAVRGEDRLRWLSGMVTNAVQQLEVQEGNYSFFLNAQGRIQGDAFVLRDENVLLLDTTADQVQPLMEHLDHFIIMDDVELVDLSTASTAIGVAGPNALGVLTQVGIQLPNPANGPSIHFRNCTWEGNPVKVIAFSGTQTPQFELIVAADAASRLWEQLVAADALPCGVEAVEALRILEGLPRYGVDIADRDLPQETSQARALNFNKGCYLGQEIVERIRSRGAVHRALHPFSLQGEMPALPVDLTAGDKSIGRLTSAFSVETSSGQQGFALGIIRIDGRSKGERLTYNGGEAELLDRPPTIQFSRT